MFRPLVTFHAESVSFLEITQVFVDYALSVTLSRTLVQTLPFLPELTEPATARQQNTDIGGMASALTTPTPTGVASPPL